VNESGVDDLEHRARGEPTCGRIALAKLGPPRWGWHQKAGLFQSARAGGQAIVPSHSAAQEACHWPGSSTPRRCAAIEETT
jgi:hypothetical protein